MKKVVLLVELAVFSAGLMAGNRFAKRIFYYRVQSVL